MSTRTLQIMLGGRIPVDIGEIKEVQLLEYLGGGTFGSVWKTVDHATQKLYTLKIIQNIRPGGVEAERVRLEAEVSVYSEFIVPVVGLCEWDANTFLILFEYFHSRSLDHWLGESRLSSEERHAVFNQILWGVADAHRSNIIHRDLKPANVLVSDEAKVKLIDFGVSKFKGRQITLDGQIIGTLPYIAPEILIDGAKNADARADIYSLGQLFYELVTGQHFWSYMGWRELDDFADFLRRDPPPTEIVELDHFNCDFYDNAGEVLRRMVKINPAERFSTVDEVLKFLGLVEETEPTEIPPLLNPMLIIESGTNRNARTFINIQEGTSDVYGRTDFAGNDESISRRHLEFTRKDSRYFVRDVESKNGTMLSGVSLEPLTWYEISHADRIKVGDIFLRFAFVQHL